MTRTRYKTETRMNTALHLSMGMSSACQPYCYACSQAHVILYQQNCNTVSVICPARLILRVVSSKASFCVVYLASSELLIILSWSRHRLVIKVLYVYLF